MSKRLRFIVMFRCWLRDVKAVANRLVLSGCKEGYDVPDAELRCFFGV